MDNNQIFSHMNKNPDFGDRYLSQHMQRVAQRQLMLQDDINELNLFMVSPEHDCLSALEKQLIQVQIQVSHTLLGTMLHRLKLATEG